MRREVRRERKEVMRREVRCDEDFESLTNIKGELVTTGKVKIVRRGALSEQKLATVLGDFLKA